jgi:hypothetical protein
MLVSGGWAHLEGEVCPTDFPPFPEGKWTGVWRHFKGRDYEVLGVACMVKTEEQLLVYRAVIGLDTVWVRPLSDWTEVIQRRGYSGPRFIRTGDGA